MLQVKDCAVGDFLNLTVLIRMLQKWYVTSAGNDCVHSGAVYVYSGNFKLRKCY
jgi:hypothetical protein